MTPVHRLIFTSGNIVFSVMLGAFAMTIFALSFDEAFKHILNVAQHVKAWLISLPMSTRYNNFVRLFLHESSFVFAFFTIISRIVVSMLGNMAVWSWRAVWGTRM